jgi:hypothetical protein
LSLSREKPVSNFDFKCNLYRYASEIGSSNKSSSYAPSSLGGSSVVSVASSGVEPEPKMPRPPNLRGVAKLKALAQGLVFAAKKQGMEQTASLKRTMAATQNSFNDAMKNIMASQANAGFFRLTMFMAVNMFIIAWLFLLPDMTNDIFLQPSG